MKIKVKITLSIGLLLVVISFLGYYAAITTQRMKENTSNILADNYNSVKYAQKMLDALYNFQHDSLNAIKTFEQNLALQKKNISEKTEYQETQEIDSLYHKYRKSPSKENLMLLSKAIDNIILLNGDAIEQKSILATESARTSFIYVIGLSVLCFAVALIMLIELPQILAAPIKKLIEGIIQISNHNYDERLDFDKKSEFGPVASSFNNMAQELSQYQKSNMAKIISTKQYLEIVINSINEPILGLNNQKYILFANKAMSNILGLTVDKIINQSALDLALSNDLLRRLIKGLDNHNEKDPLKIYANNKESYFDVNYLYLPEDSGKIIMLSNITRFKELDNAKTNFISIVSHELKTPIAAIMMSLKLLEDKRVGEMNDEQIKLAESIKESSESLLNITGELLKMTQVESGALQLNPKIIKPIELIDYAIGATRVLADKFKCNIEVDYPETIGKLFVDSEKIAWVVTNLLSNAIHYSQENSRIIIGARQIDKKIEIYVRDFGKGIDPRYHKTIFERYFRVPGTKVQGSGLGLAISKEFVEAHGGTIKVESAIGEGSVFTISFKE